MNKKNPAIFKKLSDALLILLVLATIIVACTTVSHVNAMPMPQEAMDALVAPQHAGPNRVIEDDLTPTPRHLMPVDVIDETATEPVATEPEYVELVTEIPQWFQTDYPDVWYGPYGTVSSHGCGLVCLAMVTSYLNDDPTVDIVDFAERFGAFNTPKGSYWSMFELTAEELGLEYIKQTYDWAEVEEALLNGQPVVCLQHEGIFTSGGHFIVLERFTDDGLIVVKDPNAANHEKMPEGFEYGFHVENIRAGATTYFIYGAKVLPQE